MSPDFTCATCGCSEDRHPATGHEYRWQARSDADS